MQKYSNLFLVLLLFSCSLSIAFAKNLLRKSDPLVGLGSSTNQNKEDHSGCVSLEDHLKIAKALAKAVDLVEQRSNLKSGSS